MVRGRMPGIEPPTAQQRSYERSIRGIAHVAWRHLRLSTLPAMSAASRERGDDLTDAVRRSLDRLSARLARKAKAVQAEAARVGEETERRHRSEFRARVRQAVGVDVVADEGFRGPILDRWNSDNTSLIRSVAQDAVPSLARDIEEAFASGTRPEVLARRWRERGLPLRFGTIEGRAKVIARDQIGKLNGQLTQARQQAIGIVEYVWRTSRDQRVRDAHADREGKRYRWDQPPGDGHPGHPVQCRCVAEAVLDTANLGASPADPPAPTRAAPDRVRSGPPPSPGEVMRRQTYTRNVAVQQDVDAAARKMFGARVAHLSGDELAQEVMRTTGLPATDVRSIRVAVRDGAIEVSASTNTGGTVVRTMRSVDGSVVLHNDLFVPKVPPGSGYGAQALARNVEAATRLGVAQMETFAARGDTFNGYNTWPRYGYDGPVPSRLVTRHRAELERVLGRSVADGELMISDVIAAPGGGEFWQRVGDSLDLEFDMAPNSPSRRRLMAYRRRKGLSDD